MTKLELFTRQGAAGGCFRHSREDVHKIRPAAPPGWEELSESRQAVEHSIKMVVLMLHMQKTHLNATVMKAVSTSCCSSANSRSANVPKANNKHGNHSATIIIVINYYICHCHYYWGIKDVHAPTLLQMLAAHLKGAKLNDILLKMLELSFHRCLRLHLLILTWYSSNSGKFRCVQPSATVTTLEEQPLQVIEDEETNKKNLAHQGWLGTGWGWVVKLSFSYRQSQPVTPPFTRDSLLDSFTLIWHQCLWLVDQTCVLTSDTL